MAEGVNQNGSTYASFSLSTNFQASASTMPSIALDPSSVSHNANGYRLQSTATASSSIGQNANGNLRGESAQASFSYTLTKIDNNARTFSLAENKSDLNAQMVKELFNTPPKKMDKTDKNADQAHKVVAQQNTSLKVSPYTSSSMGQNSSLGNNTPKTPTTSLIA